MSFVHFHSDYSLTLDQDQILVIGGQLEFRRKKKWLNFIQDVFKNKKTEKERGLQKELISNLNSHNNI